MSIYGHIVYAPRSAEGAIGVASIPMPARQSFGRHRHPLHQLAWAQEGVAWVEAPGGTWVLPPTRALLIPAGVPHAMGSHGAAMLRSLYLRPESCPLGWQEPTVIAAPPLLRELIVHLADPGLPAPARLRAEAVVFDLLEPVQVTTVQIKWPEDDRARRVAEALVHHPEDDRTLDDWGRTVGASGRTLARIFAAETAMTFGRWRTQVRLRAALELLAQGVPVTTVAHRVGYGTPSAFVAVFRQAFGVPPATYFKN